MGRWRVRGYTRRGKRVKGYSQRRRAARAGTYYSRIFRSRYLSGVSGHRKHK